jgi:WD40 repeat protein
MCCPKDKTIKICNVQTGDCLQTLKGHTDSVSCIKVLSEESILSGSYDGKIRIWRLKKTSALKQVMLTQMQL